MTTNINKIKSFRESLKLVRAIIKPYLLKPKMYHTVTLFFWIFLVINTILLQASSLDMLNNLSNSSAMAQSSEDNSSFTTNSYSNEKSSDYNQAISIDLDDSIEEQNITCLESGKNLFYDQKYSEAITQLENCIEKDPENPEIYYFISQSYFEQGQSAAQKKNIISATKYFRQAYQVSDKAIEKYVKLIDYYPDDDHTNDYLRLAYIYEIRSLIPGVNDSQEAIKIYKMLLDEKPYLSYIYYHLGWIYYQQKDYQNAIDNFITYLKPGIKNDFVYYHLGLSYDKIGERQKAVYYFQLILDEFPDSEIAKLAKKEM